MACGKRERKREKKKKSLQIPEAHDAHYWLGDPNILKIFLFEKASYWGEIY